MISILCLAIWWGMAPLSTMGAEAESGAQARGFRVLTYNVLGLRGFRAGENPVTNPPPARPEMLDRMVAALSELDCDVIALQEAPAQPVVEQLAKALHMEMVFFKSGWAGNKDWPGGFPGAILSRHPIEASVDFVATLPDRPKDTFIRHWGRARIKGIDIHAMHLCGGGNRSETRQAELALLKPRLHADPAEKVPTLVLCDGNFQPGRAEYDFLRGLGLVDAFAQAPLGEAMFTGGTSLAPRIRIDYIWVGEPLSGRLRSCTILDRPPFGKGDEADPVVLSDHLPVLAVFDLSAPASSRN